MILSLVTGAISATNAAAFILLAPGPDLAAYLTCSAIYSLFVWINLWTLPSAVGFHPKALGGVRRGQLLVLALGGAALLGTHPSAIGAAFVLLLALDSLIFYSSPLLYFSDTRLTQRIDFLRACLAAAALVATLAFLDASPVAFVWLLVGLTGLMLAGLWASGMHRPIVALGGASDRRGFVRQLLGALRSPQLLALLGARGVEIASLLALSAMQAFGPLLAFKLHLVIAQALSTNSRAYPAWLLLAVSALLLALGIGGAMLAAEVAPRLVPTSLELLQPAAGLTALPLGLAYLGLLVLGLRAGQAPAASVPDPLRLKEAPQ